MKTKLLIIGGSGLVGSTLLKYASPNYDIHFTYNKNKIELNGTKSTQVDLVKNRSKIVEIINYFKPNVTVYTAAHPSVDLCETEHNLADILHVDVTKDISKACKEIDSKLIYLSTDAVFRGQLGKSYLETDEPNPLNYYGKTKLQAEEIILNSSKNNVILRTAVIYDWHKKSRFSNWIIQSLKENKIVDPYTDQYNTPTLADDLVKSIIKIIELKISGLYHATGKTCLNRYEFALILAEKFGLDKNLVKPVTAIEKKQIAPRPISTCLNSSKLELAINYEFCDIQKGISFILKKSKEELN